MLITLIFVLGFVFGSFLTAYGSLLTKKAANSPAKIIQTQALDKGKNVNYIFYSSVSRRFMKNNVN